MKFICTQENLKRGFLFVNSLSNKNSTLPILNNTRLKTTEGLLELFATNLEIGIKTKVRGKVEEEGVVTAPTKVLYEYINLLSPGSVEFSSNRADVEIRTPSGVSKIKGLPAEDFPILPTLTPQIQFSLQNQDLQELVTQVVFAAASDTTRPELSGVFLKKEPGTLICAATDSFRLAECRKPITAEFADFSIIIPLRAMHEVLRMCALYPDDQTVLISFNESQVDFTIDTTTIISRLIEGIYPEYSQIIPSQSTFSSAVKNGDFIHAIKVNSLFTKKGTNDVVCEFQSPASISISSNNIQVGESTTRIEAEVGGNDKILFNFRYLLEGLAIFDSNETIQVKIVNQNSPILFTSESKKGFLYLVMPIRQ